MVDLSNFRLWLNETKAYSDRTISNTVSRLKRADSFLPWFNDPVYQFRLEQLGEYYQSSMDNSLRHLDYMQSVDYYSKHLF